MGVLSMYFLVALVIFISNGTSLSGVEKLPNWVQTIGIKGTIQGKGDYVQSYHKTLTECQQALLDADKAAKVIYKSEAKSQGKMVHVMGACLPTTSTGDVLP
jgi:hypothetical protein